MKWNHLCIDFRNLPIVRKIRWKLDSRNRKIDSAVQKKSILKVNRFRSTNLQKSILIDKPTWQWISPNWMRSRSFISLQPYATPEIFVQNSLALFAPKKNTPFRITSSAILIRFKLPNTPSLNLLVHNLHISVRNDASGIIIELKIFPQVPDIAPSSVISSRRALRSRLKQHFARLYVVSS